MMEAERGVEETPIKQIDSFSLPKTDRNQNTKNQQPKELERFPG
jgi:hypothetical protein